MNTLRVLYFKICKPTINTIRHKKSVTLVHSIHMHCCNLSVIISEHLGAVWGGLVRRSWQFHFLSNLFFCCQILDRLAQWIFKPRLITLPQLRFHNYCLNDDSPNFQVALGQTAY